MFSGLSSGFLKSSQEPSQEMRQRSSNKTTKTNVISPPKCNRNDYHCWVERSDGTIYDTYFEQYDFIKSFNRIPHNAKQCYEPIQDAIERDNVWKELYETNILPNIKEYGDDIIDKFISSPRPGHCSINAYVYHIRNKHSKLMVGKMGWENDDGIWWEIG